MVMHQLWCLMFGLNQTSTSPHYLPIQYMYKDQNLVCYLIRVLMTKLWVRLDKLLQNNFLDLK